MHVNLSPEMENYLQSKVGTGFYGNASEVVRDAIRRMREEDGRVSALQSAVKIGDEQMARGEGNAYTPERLQLLTKKAVANAKKGKKVNPDVTG